MNETDKILRIFKIDGRKKEPKSKQIINAVTEAVKKEDLEIGERLPSLNNVSFELDVSKDTIQRAYVGLCDRGIIESVPGKGDEYMKLECIREVFGVKKHGTGIASSMKNDQHETTE
jgi:DNA-binding transcriptional regulator YhcF (GntR family)